MPNSGDSRLSPGRIALGYPATELQGKRPEDFIEETLAHAQQEEQQSNTQECRLRTDSDRKIWVLISRHPVVNDAGVVV